LLVVLRFLTTQVERLANVEVSREPESEIKEQPLVNEERKKLLQELKLMPTKWEQDLFDKPWLPVAMLIPIGGLFLIGLAEDIYYYLEIFKGSDLSFQLLAAYFSLDVIYVSFALLAMVIVWLYQRFAKQTPRALLRLWEKGTLSPKTAVDDTGETSIVADFLNLHRDALSARKRFIIVGAVLFIVDIKLWNYIMTIYTLSFETFPDATGSLFIVFKFVIFPDLWLWITLTAGWSMLVTARFIRRLPMGLNLEVIPSHPDQCGGLKSIGDICIQLALIAVIASLVLAYWGSIGRALRTAGVLPNLSDEVETVAEKFLPETLSRFRELIDPTREPQPITRAFANIGTIAGIIGGGWLFLYPLLGIHQRMRDKKAEFMQELAEAAAEFDMELEQSIHARDEEQIREAHEKLETLQNTHSLLKKYPVWPVSKGVFVEKFVTPQFLTVIGLILNVNVDIASKTLEWIGLSGGG